MAARGFRGGAAAATEDPDAHFAVPDDVVWRDVDPATGLLATAGCPERRHEPFLAGTEPHELCERHRPLIAAFGEGLGGAVRGGARALGSGGDRIRSWFRELFR